AVVVCESTTILPEGREWERADAYGGVGGWGRGEAYYCRSGTWRFDHHWGACECVDGLLSEWGESCGTGYTGHARGYGYRVCEPYMRDTWGVDRSECVCVGATEVEPAECPSGYSAVN